MPVTGSFVGMTDAFQEMPVEIQVSSIGGERCAGIPVGRHGPSDLVARIPADRMKATLGQTVRGRRSSQLDLIFDRKAAPNLT